MSQFEATKWPQKATGWLLDAFSWPRIAVECSEAHGAATFQPAAFLFLVAGFMRFDHFAGSVGIGGTDLNLNLGRDLG